MATRVFFTEDTTAPAVSPTISATDWLHINTVRRKLVLTADSSALGTTAYTPDTADDLIAGKAHHRQYISDPLSAQTILSSSTVQAQFQTLEAHANNNLTLTLKVYTVDSGGTLKSALLAVVGKGTEPTTALRNTSFAATALNGSGGNVTVVAGDRIVVEIGLGGTPTATSGTQGHNGSIRWGCNASSGDLPVDETQAGTTYRPWVEFSQNLLFLKTASFAADDAEQYADTIIGGKYRLGWQDSTAAEAPVTGAGVLTVTPPADPLGSYVDARSAFFTYANSQTDALGSYADTAAKALRSLPGWNDQLGTFVSGVTTISVSLPADGLGGYLDQAPTILYTGALTLAPAADSLGLYLDQAPTISLTGALAIAPTGDSLGLYLDQAPTVREDILTAPIADSLSAYTETINGFFTIAARQTDALNLWTDQINVSMGAGSITIGPPADALNNWADAPTIGGTAAYSITLSDSLGLYADQPTIIEAFSAALPADSLGLYLDQAPTIFRQGILSAIPPADSLAAYGETVNGFFTIAAQLSDALVYIDQLLISAGGQKVAGFTDALGPYSDALTITYGINLAFADGLDNWSDQVSRSGVRVGWGDSVAVTRPVGNAYQVDLASVRPVPLDNFNLRLGYLHGGVIYLVDDTGNYIVDENGNRFIISGLIDNLQQQQGDSVAITRTASGITPRLVTLTDALPTYSDSLQVTSGIVTLIASLSEAPSIPVDSLQAQYIGVLVSSLSDALGSYNDSSPAMSTSGELRVSQADALPNYLDAIQLRQIGNISISLSDLLAGYNDTAAINTSGGISVALSDAFQAPNDSIQVERGGALNIVFLEALGGSYGDALTVTSGILRSASDNLAGYADSAAQRRGLFYSLTDNAANYLDVMTVGGSGQLQAALSDNLGQYNDNVPTTFANKRMQAADNLASYVDSVAGLLALNYRFFEDFLLLDGIDSRTGLFNELRYTLSDNTFNHWADAAAWHRTFFAIRVGGELVDRIIVTGKVIEEQIDIGGNLDDSVEISGELDIGEP